VAAAAPEVKAPLRIFGMAAEVVGVDKPGLSVIVPTRNRPGQLRKALESINRETAAVGRAEILVCDNGSDVETATVVAQAGARHILVSRRGAAAARNAGLFAAKGRFIAFLDDDDAWVPGHLAQLMGELEANSDVVGVVGQAVNTDETMETFGPPWPAALPEDGDYFRSFLRYFPQIGATVVRASVRETVGLFDEALTADQDWDWHLRLALSHRLAFVPVPSVYFRQRPTGSDDELLWERMKFTRRVFLRNVRRGGLRRTGIGFALRTWVHHAGQFESHYRDSACRWSRQGDRRRTGAAVSKAVLTSPLHFGFQLATDRPLRKAALKAVWG
jgi:glycosyltransferase involved in cell wall biosynthesis